ncbi:RNA-binding protein [Nanoarchaeota archaeon]|nr:MAG: RNA-binding protein [Nanoarchaeota archaeon]
MNDYINDLIRENLRVDERDMLQYRNIKISTGVVKNASGSAMVEIGNTKVVAGVKFDIGEPFSDAPDKGVLITNAEFVPFAAPEFEPGPPDQYAVELARVVDRGIRESEAVDLSKLCIVPGEKVMMMFVDIYVLNNAGNLTDAASLAVIAAMKTARMPKVENGELLQNEVGEPLPVVRTPISVTVYKINGKLLIDANDREEQASSASLTVILDEDGIIHGMQKRGSGYITEQEFSDILEIVKNKYDELKSIVDKVVDDGAHEV